MDVSAPPPNGPTFFDSDQPHTPTTEVHNDRNQTPNQSKAYQKRKAYEVPLLPAPPKTSKIQKFETPGVSRISASRAAQPQGGSGGRKKRRARKKKAKPVVGQPGPSDPHRGMSSVVAEDSRGDRDVEDVKIEDGEIYVYGEGGSGGEADYDPAHPYGVEYTWGQSGTADDTREPWL
jgi:hypothetical protein